MIRKIICYTVLLSDSGCKNNMLCYVRERDPDGLRLTNFANSNVLDLKQI